MLTRKRKRDFKESIKDDVKRICSDFGNITFLRILVADIDSKLPVNEMTHFELCKILSDEYELKLELKLPTMDQISDFLGEEEKDNEIDGVQIFDDIKQELLINPVQLSNGTIINEEDMEYYPVGEYGPKRIILNETVRRDDLKRQIQDLLLRKYGIKY